MTAPAPMAREIPAARELSELARRARGLILDMAAGARGCHLGGSLSVIDLLIAAYAVFGRDPRHQVVLSKGHAAAALYAALHVFGILEENPAPFYGLAGRPYTGHPGSKVPGVLFPTGSLGHGIPCALGWALAQRLRGEGGLGVAVAGDGELQEGLCWESFQIAQAKSIGNFILLVDVNGGQNDGLVRAISPEPLLRERFAAFGFAVAEVDGHDHGRIVEALRGHPAEAGCPLAVLARTVKGKGVREIEGKAESHYAVVAPARAALWKRSLP